MIFLPTALAGVYVIEVERREDPRGFFARSWCREEFQAQGLVADIAQCSVSFNRRRGTLRGMHYQGAPYEETKVVRCTMGRVFDVALDLRRGSATYCRWFGMDLSAENRRALYIPRGVAHGFQTLDDDAEVFYQISEPYRPEAVRGVRWDDPAFGISWPLPDPVLSEKDRAYPDFRDLP